MQPILNLSTLLERSAVAHPTKIVVEDALDNKITYQELNNVSEKIEDILKQYNVGFGDRVGVLVPKSIDTIGFIFAILKTGAAYVPMDNKAPGSRNTFICNDCGLQAIFIEKKTINDLISNSEFRDLYYEVNINEKFSLLVFKEKQQTHDEPLAYIIYTSGSTGAPKGVKHTHKSAYAFINWTVETFFPNATDRVLSYAPFYFDLSIFDIFATISVGATIVLADEKIVSTPMLFAQCLSKKQISILYATPSALSYITTFGKMEKYTYENLKLVLFAGEVFPISKLKELKGRLSKTQFFNLYGPTETNVCTWFKIPSVISEDKQEPYPIGKVCDYAKYRIVKSEDGKKSEGELLIAGDSLMNGYWNDAEKTKMAIEIDNEGRFWYHTGDIVTLNDDDDLVYLRRMDRMVKRNGYRIELNEIERNLAINKNIAEVAVTAESLNNQTDTIITAHLVWMENNELSTLELLDYCNSVLPIYMIPDNFKFYKQLPKTSTHKIDYKQLAIL